MGTQERLGVNIHVDQVRNKKDPLRFGFPSVSRYRLTIRLMLFGPSTCLFLSVIQ